MNCRRWCVGVTVVVAAVGIGGIPAAAQQTPPAVELPAVTVPAVDVPVPSGAPKVQTPPISTPEISTPAVKTPPIQTPVTTVPSVSVPAVKVAPVSVSPVRTVPAAGGPAGKPTPGGGAGEVPKRTDPPSSGGAADRGARAAAPAVAVRDARSGSRPATTPHPQPAAAVHRRRPAQTAPDRHATLTAHPRGQLPAARDTTPAPRVVRDRTLPAAVPVADAVERHEAAERPLIDSLGSALRLAPILMALALAGALCVGSRLRRA